MKYQKVRLLVAACMLLSAILAPAATAFAAPAQGIGATPVFQAPESPDAPAGPQPFVTAAQASQQKPRVMGETDPGGTDPTRYIVLLHADPLALYRGGVEGMAATNPTAASEGRLKLESASAQAYLSYLDAQQATALNAISATIGRTPDKVFDYRITLNGFVLEMTPEEARQVVMLDEVKSVQRDSLLDLLTDAGPAWIGAPQVWDGSAVADGVGTLGEGVVVGILDTGINMDHPSFAATGEDGYTHVNPRGKYYGVCDPESEVYDAAFTCNDKLIGAWDFADGYGFFTDEWDGPEDNHGHGSHTASTVAGNKLSNAAMDMPGFRYEAPISGVAPHANIIAYDVCLLEGCPLSSIEAGIEQATADQVDVINFSIGGYPESPWIDSVAMAFLAASEAGVTVVTAAGNEGPTPGTVGSPANAPWLLSMGASSHNRLIANSLVDLTGGDAPPANIIGKGLTGGYGPAPVVYAGYYGNPYCDDFLESNIFSGEIVLCDRGEIGRIEKGRNVRQAGAGGMILANGMTDGDSLLADPHTLPTTHVSYVDGLRLKLWLARGTGHMGTISGVFVDRDAANGDLTAGFSSRGPNAPLPDVLKPDLAAPGVDIFAAYKDPERFQMISGTSMASPHGAGAAALVKAVHPDWTPAQIRSALMLTAQVEGVREEDRVTPASPHARGAGRVDVARAVRAGFTLDESAGAFQDADTDAGGDAATLNLASLSKGDCRGQCSWTRALTSVSDQPVAWTVETQGDPGLALTVDPASFTLEPGETISVTVSANLGVESLEEWVFGQVMFTPDSEDVAIAHFPVAIFSSVGELADVSIETRRTQGIYTIPDLATIQLDHLDTTIHASKEERLPTQIGYDAGNYNAYDLDSPGVVWLTRSITDTTRLFVVNTSESTAYDLDLYVGIDFNGNGQPDPMEEICAPYTYSADEECRFTAPLEAGEYWIMVHNFSGSGAETDEFLLSIFILGDESVDGITATAPASVNAGEPFDVSIEWDSSEITPGDRWMGILELSDRDSETVLLSSDFSFTRLEDDVTFTSTAQSLWPKRTLDYAIDIRPEPVGKGDTTDYTFIVTLPPGVTYLPGSASVEPTSIIGNVLTWENMDITRFGYAMSDSDHDPSCATFQGGYINLVDYYIEPYFELTGSDFVVDIDDFFYGPDPYTFYGVEFPNFYVTANGFGTFDPDVGDQPGVNSDLPDPALPNSLIAPFWRDLEIVYDVVYDWETGEYTSLRGVSIAGTWDGNEMVIEYDDVEPAPAGSTEDRYDFEIVLLRRVDDTPGAYEIVLAYDNIQGATTPATVGIENPAGSVAEKYAYNDAQLHDGLMICYDLTTPTTTITFQAMVSDATPPGTVTATLEHRPNAPGYRTLTEELEFISYGPDVKRLLLPMVVR